LLLTSGRNRSNYTLCSHLFVYLTGVGVRCAQLQIVYKRPCTDLGALGLYIFALSIQYAFNCSPFFQRNNLADQHSPRILQETTVCRFTNWTRCTATTPSSSTWPALEPLSKVFWKPSCQFEAICPKPNDASARYVISSRNLNILQIVPPTARATSRVNSCRPRFNRRALRNESALRCGNAVNAYCDGELTSRFLRRLPSQNSPA